GQRCRCAKALKAAKSSEAGRQEPSVGAQASAPAPRRKAREKGKKIEGLWLSRQTGLISPRLSFLLIQLPQHGELGSLENVLAEHILKNRRASGISDPEAVELQELVEAIHNPAGFVVTRLIGVVPVENR